MGRIAAQAVVRHLEDELALNPDEFVISQDQKRVDARSDRAIKLVTRHAHRLTADLDGWKVELTEAISRRGLLFHDSQGRAARLAWRR